MPWRRELPDEGVWCLDFASGEDVNVPLRAALAALATAVDPFFFKGVGDPTQLWGRHSHNREPLTAADFASQSRDKFNLPRDVFPWEERGPSSSMSGMGSRASLDG